MVVKGSNFKLQTWATLFPQGASGGDISTLSVHRERFLWTVSGKPDHTPIPSVWIVGLSI